MQESALSLASPTYQLLVGGIKDSLFVVSEEIVVIGLFGHTRVDLLKSTDFDPLITYRCRMADPKTSHLNILNSLKGGLKAEPVKMLVCK